MDKNSFYRKIPKVDVLLGEKEAEELIQEYGYSAVCGAVRSALQQERERVGAILQNESAPGNVPENVMEAAGEPALCGEAAPENTPENAGKHALCGDQQRRIFDCAARLLEKEFRPEIRQVLNGTGVILHTGLGRAPLGEHVLAAGLRAAGGYTSLEYDLETGKRGERSSHFERVLCRITGARAAMAVNNNAAAVLLALTALARGKEVPVSRGELVEIGGQFRIPDVMEQSGAVLREVGTTNRTRLADYERALCEDTGAVMKVHTSNYRIVGFTESVGTAELSALCREKGIPLIADLGSGVLVNLEKYGLKGEPTVQELIRQGADVVCFSGDKLLGGPQAGVIAGKKEYIERMRRHPLARALRIDKFTAAALEAVMLEYLHPEQAVRNIPVLRMLTRPAESVRGEAQKAAEMLQNAAGASAADITVTPCVSAAGGGSLPEEEIQSYAVAILPKEISAPELERRLRHLDTPVVGRISGGQVLLDMRTFEKNGAEYLAEVFRNSDILNVQGGDAG